MALAEFDLIDRYFRGLSDRDGVVVGIGDDCAIVNWKPPLAIATDTLVEGVHFPAAIDPVALGHRCLAVNLSDLAAMGAVPLGFTLALTLSEVEANWIADFTRGLGDLARGHSVALIGGDTTRGQLATTVTVIGRIETECLTRAGASPGDAIFVSGELGGALAGLEMVELTSPTGQQSHWLDRFLYPEPRLELGRGLVKIASAAIDVSDGCLADLGHLVRASGCGATVNLEWLPVSAGLVEYYGEADALERAACGGDEYELCFTVPPNRVDELPALGKRVGLPLTQIGTVTDSADVRVSWNGASWQPERNLGYEHFF